MNDLEALGDPEPNDSSEIRANEYFPAGVEARGTERCLGGGAWIEIRGEADEPLGNE